MTLIRKNAVVERHRQFAKEKEISMMGNRSRKRIDFVNKEILRMINPQLNDIVIDIGCGDASLLRLLSESVEICYGTAATDEEILRLRQEYAQNKKMKFSKWFSQSLPFEDEMFTLVICNATLHIFHEKEKALEILREISRVSKNGATIIIGEIPDSDESDRTAHGNSILKIAINKLSKRKFNDLIRFTWRIFKALFTNYVYYLMPADHLILKPTEFIELVSKVGLNVVSYHKHKDMCESGEIFESPTRWDYILLKP